ncbi:CbtB domain-containing protein [Phytohalomonas tamaricis]|uniref:CbtB domain-containing protein n=1 Tax=Phytohalomonas tamaricis TaxID=2081032 RepID=UPI000D0AFE3A|nr:CbtB domain-containing protein [Phytohalomonas tamaricis]
MPISSVSSPAAVNDTALAKPSIMQLSLATLFGVSILFMIGFAKMDVAHNAAHDTRHTLVFPCH